MTRFVRIRSMAQVRKFGGKMRRSGKTTKKRVRSAAEIAAAKAKHTANKAKEAAAKRDLIFQLAGYGIPAPEDEHAFCPGRRWRFDLAFPECMIGFELDGGSWSRGRHNRGAGFSQDASKLNEAAILGWLIVRATYDMLRDGSAASTLARAYRAAIGRMTDEAHAAPQTHAPEKEDTPAQCVRCDGQAVASKWRPTLACRSDDGSEFRICFDCSVTLVRAHAVTVADWCRGVIPASVVIAIGRSTSADAEGKVRARP